MWLLCNLRLNPGSAVTFNFHVSIHSRLLIMSFSIFLKLNARISWIGISRFFFITLIFYFYFQTLNFLFCIGLWPINNVMVVSGEQQGTQPFIYVPSPLPSRLALNIEQCPTSYIIAPCWLSILNIAVCTWASPNSWLSFPPSNHKFVF